MFRTTPLKNSPNVSKPFRSPFEKRDNSKDEEAGSSKETPKRLKMELSASKASDKTPQSMKLKRRIFEKRQELDCLKSRQLLSKKHNPEVLKASIAKWRSACQDALELLSKELSERNGKSVSIPEVLSSLSIPEALVHYSREDEAFV